MALVLAIIPARNEEKYIAYSATSIITQKTRHKITTVLVDDNSSDNTYNVMVKIANKYRHVYPIRVPRRGGYSTGFGAVLAIHFGVLYAEKELGIKWDYITYIDADTILEKLYIEKIVGIMEERPDIGIAGGIIVNEPVSRFHVPGTGMVVRRKVWEQTGGLPAGPAPDTFLQMRSILLGWKIAVVKTAKMYLLRPTGMRERKSRCAVMGLTDGYVCASKIYAALRVLRLLSSTLSPKCAIGYLAGLIRGYRMKDSRLCPVRRLVELQRIYGRLRKR